MDYAAQAAQADTLRVNRLFVGFLSTVLGNDQNFLNEDNYVGQRSNNQMIANPDGSVSVQGLPVSNVQTSANQPSLLPLILLGLAVWKLAK